MLYYSIIQFTLIVYYMWVRGLPRGRRGLALLLAPFQLRLLCHVSLSLTHMYVCISLSLSF